MQVVFKAPLRFDAEGVAINRSVIERLANSNQDVVVDMADVELIDGSGFGAIAHLHKRLLRHKHTVRVINVDGQPRDLMARTGMLDVLTTRAPVVAGDAVVIAAVQVEPARRDVEIDQHKTAA